MIRTKKTMTTEVGIKLLESVKGSKMQYYGAAVLGCLCAGKDLKTRGLKGLFADITGAGCPVPSPAQEYGLLSMLFIFINPFGPTANFITLGAVQNGLACNERKVQWTPEVKTENRPLNLWIRNTDKKIFCRRTTVCSVDSMHSSPKSSRSKGTGSEL